MSLKVPLIKKRKNIVLYCLLLDLVAIPQKSLDRATICMHIYTQDSIAQRLGLYSILRSIDDYAKDGGKELFTKMHRVL